MNALVPFYAFNLATCIETGLGVLLKNELASPVLHGSDKYSCFAFSSVETSLLYSLVFTIAKISVKHTSLLYSLVFTIAKIIVKHREFRREL